jgi:hypothetical protein
LKITKKNTANKKEGEEGKVYEELIGKQVKIVCVDAEQFSIYKGKVLMFDEITGFLKFYEFIKQKNLFLNVKYIQKIEVLT